MRRDDGSACFLRRRRIGGTMPLVAFGPIRGERWHHGRKDQLQCDEVASREDLCLYFWDLCITAAEEWRLLFVRLPVQDSTGREWCLIPSFNPPPPLIVITKNVIGRAWEKKGRRLPKRKERVAYYDITWQKVFASLRKMQQIWVCSSCLTSDFSSHFPI